MSRVLVFGAAAGVGEEIAAAQAIMSFDLVVAVKRYGCEYPGRIDHWVSFHPEFFEEWIAIRARRGYPPAGAYWASNYKGSGLRGERWPFYLQRVNCEGGSSGFIGVAVARKEGATKIVLAGIPMDGERGHFNKPGPWKEAIIHRQAWVDHYPQLQGVVRSMSGWTREVFGAPEEEWREAA